MKKFFSQLLVWLHVRSAAAGLEVSDDVVRVAAYDGKLWKFHAVRLEPGTLEAGRIKDRARFIAALAKLREEMRLKKKLNVVLCISSLPTFIQTITLPSVKGEDFEQAVALNLAMVSPLETDKAYSGWQNLGRDEATLQDRVMAAFVERQAVDEMVNALFEGGFLTMAVESRALVLARILRRASTGVDLSQSYLFLTVDNAGLDFVILRQGALIFEYAEPWRDLADEKGEIAVDRFKGALAAGTRQVLNFHRQHATDQLAGIVLSSLILPEETLEVVSSAAIIPVIPLSLNVAQEITPEWLAVLGAGLRDQEGADARPEINLLGESSRDLFNEEQILNFLGFWRAMIPVVLGVIVLMFWIADIFLASTRIEIESRSDFNVGNAQSNEVASFQQQSTEFNRMVALLDAAERVASPKNVLVSKLISAASAHNVTISRISFSTPGAPITVSGSGFNQEDIVGFKNALENDKSFSSVDLPLTGIQPLAIGTSFSMTVTYIPPTP